MSEPYLTTRDMLQRIEVELSAVRSDVHEMQLALARSSATVVSEAAESASSRARAAVWAAAGSGIAATAAVVVAIVKH